MRSWEVAKVAEAESKEQKDNRQRKLGGHPKRFGLSTEVSGTPLLGLKR